MYPNGLETNQVSNQWQSLMGFAIAAVVATSAIDVRSFFHGLALRAAVFA